MTKMTYGEQLKHPNWQRKRLRILSRDGWICQRCGGADKTLHVHHKLYIKGRMVWEYDDSDLKTLCEDCHEQAHDGSDLPLRRLIADCDQRRVYQLVSGFHSVAISAEDRRALFDRDPVAFAGYVASTLALLTWEDAQAIELAVSHLFAVEAGLAKPDVPRGDGG